MPWLVATPQRLNSPMNEALDFGLFVWNELKELKERSRVHDAQEKAFLLYRTLNAVSKGDDKAF